MDNLRLELKLDLKQFLTQLESTENFSQQTVAELQKIFGTVKSVQVPFDSKKIKEELDKVSKSTLPATTGMNRAAQSAQSLSYIVRDSPYFFQNFNMGLMAVGNNLNPFIDQLILAKKETGSWKGALGQLGQGIGGVGGISFIFSLAVSAITAYALATGNAKEETKGLKEETDKLRESLEKASYETLRREEAKAMMKLSLAEIKLREEQNTEYEDAIVKARVRSQSASVTINKDVLGTAATKEEVKNNQELLDTIRKYKSELGLVGEQENRIAELREKRRRLKTPEEIAEIDKKIEALEKKYRRETKETKETKLSDEITIMKEYIGYTDRMIRDEIKLNQAKLDDPNFKGDRVAVLEKIIMLNKVQQGVTESYLRLFDIAKSKGYKDQFDMKPLENLPKSNPAFKETTAELERMLALSNMLTDSFNQAGDAVADAMGRSTVVFKQANSLGQIFINTLTQAIIKAVTLKLIMVGLDFLGSFIGIPGLGSSASSIAGFASSGSNSPSQINGYGNSINNISSIGNLPKNLSLLNTTSYRFSNANIAPIIQQIPVVLDTKMRGRDIYLVQRKQENYRRKFYGAS